MVDDRRSVVTVTFDATIKGFNVLVKDKQDPGVEGPPRGDRRAPGNIFILL